jgi:hypothetical protein
MNFADGYATGKAGESAIARWLIERGASILPVYEKLIDEGKGPQVFQKGHSLIAPDFCVFGRSGVIWIEAKHKAAFTWWRQGGVFETGIDRRHWRDYCTIRDSIGLPVWLLFLHRGGQAKDSPPSPSGLFGAEIMELRQRPSHRSDKWGLSGMIYWTRTDDGGPLRLLAAYEEVMRTMIPVGVKSTEDREGQ